jgi:hypothetical protein
MQARTSIYEKRMGTHQLGIIAEYSLGHYADISPPNNKHYSNKSNIIMTIARNIHI